MTDAAWVLLAVAGVLAVTDWVAVANGWRRIEGVAKPSVIVALLAVAVAVEPFDEVVRALVVLALAFSLVGDVLLFAGDRLFLLGLVSFLIAHVHYIAAFVVAGVTVGWLLVGLLVFGLAVGAVGWRIAMAAGSGGRPDVAVSLYIGVLAAMGVTAVGTATWLAVVGATLFVISDSVLGWTRFVAGFPRSRVVVHSTYHLAQAALVIYVAA